MMTAAVQVCPGNLTICFAVSGDCCYGARFSRLYLCASSMGDVLPEVSFSASSLRSLKQGLPGEVVDLRPIRLSQAVSALQHTERCTERWL